MYWNVLENWGICSEFFFILDIPPHLICLMPVNFIIHALPFLIYIRILPYTPNSFTMSWWWNSWFVFLGISFANVFFPVCQFFILCQTEASCSSLFQSCPVYSLLGIRNLVQYLSLRQITLHYSPITQHSKRGVIKTA